MVLNKQKQTTPEDGNPISYFLSDFQKSITDFPVQEDTTREINLLSFQSVMESNIAIDSVWFESIVPSINQSNKLYIRLKNFSDERKEDVRISINHNGQNRPEGTIDLPAFSSKTDTINLLFNQPGWQELSIQIDDFPIQFDDVYYTSFNIKSDIRVLAINNEGSSKYLNALFRGLPQFKLDNANINNIQYDQLKNYDLLILRDLDVISSGLSGELINFISLGGNVLTFPSDKADKSSYNNFLKAIGANTITSWNPEEQNVYRINTSEFVFENVFENNRGNLKLPTTNGNFNTTDFSSNAAEFLLKYRNGTDYLRKYSFEKGHLYFCVSPLDRTFNDLTTNAEVFVPLLYKLGFSSNQDDQLSLTIGKDNILTLNASGSNGDIIYKIEGTSEFIPGQTNMGTATQINFNNMVTDAGYYDLKLADNLVKKLAFNYDRKESDLDYFSNRELNRQIWLQYQRY